MKEEEPMSIADEVFSRLTAGEPAEEIADDLGLELEDDAVILPGWVADARRLQGKSWRLGTWRRGDNP
jgi:hypothetical protein